MIELLLASWSQSSVFTDILLSLADLFIFLCLYFSQCLHVVPSLWWVLQIVVVIDVVCIV